MLEAEHCGDFTKTARRALRELAKPVESHAEAFTPAEVSGVYSFPFGPFFRSFSPFKSQSTRRARYLPGTFEPLTIVATCSTQVFAVVRSYERAYDECWAHHPTVAGASPVPVEPLPSSGHGKPFDSSFDRYARVDGWPRYAKTARFYDSQSELRDGCVTRLDSTRFQFCSPLIPKVHPASDRWMTLF